MRVNEIKFERRMVEQIEAWYNVKLIPEIPDSAIEGFVEAHVVMQLENELSDLELPMLGLWEWTLKLDDAVVNGTIGAVVMLTREKK